MPNWKKIIVSGSDASLNSLNVTAGVTGSLLGTASTASYVVTAQTASFYGGSVTSASYASNATTAQTASFVVTAQTASFVNAASTASFVNPLNQNVVITGSASNSLRVKGSGATSSTNTLYLENSSNINTFAVTDNGNVTINTGSLTVNQATGTGTGIILKAPTDYYSPKLEFNAIGGTSRIIQGYGGQLFLEGGNALKVSFGVYAAAGTVSNVDIYTYPYGGSQPAYPNNYSMLIKNPDTTGVNLMIRAASGQAGTGNITEWQNSGGTEVVAKITASGSAYFKSDITASSFSGSHIGPLTGTASYATTALTASNANTASFVTTAQTASYVLQAVSSSFASTASFVNPLNQNVLITGSLTVSSSNTTQFQVGSNLVFVSSSGVVDFGNSSQLYNTWLQYSLGTLKLNRNTTSNFYWNGSELILTGVNGDGNASLQFTAIAARSQILIRGSNNKRLSFSSDGANTAMQLASNGNLYIGTDDAAGVTATARLEIKGSGATSATNALLIKNSSGTALLTVNDAGNITGSFTGSLLGTASTASYVVTAQTASFYGGSVTSASYASNATSASYAPGGTVNTGTSAKLAYYPSTGDTVDDAANLEYDGTNLKLISTSQLDFYTNAGSIYFGNFSSPSYGRVGFSVPGQAVMVVDYSNARAGFGGGTSLITSAPAGLVEIQGKANEIQLLVKGNSTQTNNIFEVQKSTGAILYYLDNNGDAKLASGSLGVGIAPNGTDGRIDASNDIVAFSTSDINWKTNIKPIENAIDKVKQISGNTFDWIEDTNPVGKIHGNKGKDVGVIAQEIEKVLPEIVTTRESGIKAVKYEKIVALLIEAIKEQQQQIDELKSKLK